MLKVFESFKGLIRKVKDFYWKDYNCVWNLKGIYFLIARDYNIHTTKEQGVCFQHIWIQLTPPEFESLGFNLRTFLTRSSRCCRSITGT